MGLEAFLSFCVVLRVIIISVTFVKIKSIQTYFITGQPAGTIPAPADTTKLTTIVTPSLTVSFRFEKEEFSWKQPHFLYILFLNEKQNSGSNPAVPTEGDQQYLIFNNLDACNIEASSKIYRLLIIQGFLPVASVFVILHHPYNSTEKRNVAALLQSATRLI
jgi:hypothetical protein